MEQLTTAEKRARIKGYHSPGPTGWVDQMNDDELNEFFAKFEKTAGYQAFLAFRALRELWRSLVPARFN